MYKPTVALFFSLLFVALITAPTIDMLLDSDYDVSILLDSCDEEEKEGKESKKDIEVKVLQISDKDSSSIALIETSLLGFYFNKYASAHKELFLPPPEHRSVFSV